MRLALYPDLPFLLPAPAILAVAAVVIWRRWRGWWRRASAVPLVFVVAAAIVTRPLWSDARVAWSGYDALFRHAGVIPAGFFTTACVIVIRAARRARP